MSDSNTGLPVAAPIISITRDNYRTKTFTLDMKLDARPGQFIMVWLPGFDEKPFSLVNTDPVRVMITDVGPFTGLVHQKQVGERIWVRGPFGHGFDAESFGRHALLVGGGYGVAPLLWLANSMSGKTECVTVAVGARTKTDLLYVNRFRALAERDASTQIDILVTTDDGSEGARGVVTEAIMPLLATGDVTQIYACGPHPMLAALRQLALRHRVPCQLSWEEYMRCGMGLCGSCEFEGALLCLDGPVIAVVA